MILTHHHHHTRRQRGFEQKLFAKKQINPGTERHHEESGKALPALRAWAG
jgi:hypothetical protein